MPTLKSAEQLLKVYSPLCTARFLGFKGHSALRAATALQAPQIFRDGVNSRVLAESLYLHEGFRSRETLVRSSYKGEFDKQIIKLLEQREHITDPLSHRRDDVTISYAQGRGPVENIGIFKKTAQLTAFTLGFQTRAMEPQIPVLKIAHGKYSLLSARNRSTEVFNVPDMMISASPVRIDLFREFLLDTDHRYIGRPDVCGDLQGTKGGLKGAWSVTEVSLGDALAFCKWLSGKTGKNISVPADYEYDIAQTYGDMYEGDVFQFMSNTFIRSWDRENEKDSGLAFRGFRLDEDVCKIGFNMPFVTWVDLLYLFRPLNLRPDQTRSDIGFRIVIKD